MDATALHRALSDASRVRILRAVRASDSGLDVAGLAALVRLHPNTVRAHLAVLEEAHLVVHEVEHAARRGRPRTLYVSAHRLDADGTAAPVLELLDGLGFEPELTGEAEAPEVRMYRCPFGITPDAPEPKVCRAHVGLVRGVLAELASPLVLDRLDVFPEPSYCAIRLHSVGETT